MKDNLEDIYEYVIERIKYERMENDYETRQSEEDALKIYRTSTLNFNSIIKYIEGDYRFEHIRRTKSGLISVWAQKEFRNLTDCFKAEVNVPKPITFRENIIMMQYLGKKSYVAPMLKDTLMKEPEKMYNEIKENITKMVNIANLVHGDLSEYNIVYFNDKPYIIDVSQALP